MRKRAKPTVALVKGEATPTQFTLAGWTAINGRARSSARRSETPASAVFCEIPITNRLPDKHARSAYSGQCVGTSSRAERRRSRTYPAWGCQTSPVLKPQHAGHADQVGPRRASTFLGSVCLPEGLACGRSSDCIIERAPRRTHPGPPRWPTERSGAARSSGGWLASGVERLAWFPHGDEIADGGYSRDEPTAMLSLPWTPPDRIAR